jgi:peptide/nickel transport system substrate-binding protein
MVNQRAFDALMLDILQGRVSRRALLKRAAVLGITGPTLGALLAACGDDDDDDAPAAPGTTPAPADDDDDDDEDEDEDEETPEPDDDDDDEDDDDDAPSEAAGRLVLLQGVDSNNLDPLLRNSVPEFTVNFHVFDWFTERDAETLEITGGILEDWTVVDDLTWEFKLVEGAEFHDGTPVNAEAAVFTFERAAQTQIGDSGRVQSLVPQSGYESSEVIDEYSFRVHTSRPAAIFLDLLTSFEICPPSHYEDDSADNIAHVAANPLGSGPYEFVEWIRDDHITLRANRNYWKFTPQIEEIIIRPVPELSARVIALQNQEAHIIVNVAPEVVPQVEEHADTRISDVVGGRSIFVGIRNDVEPFDDVRVRQALNYAVDWDSIKDALLEGYGEKMKTIVNPPNDNPDLTAYPYDPDRARALLDEAGVPEGHPVVMNAPRGRYIKDDELAQAVAQDFRRVGFDIDLQVLDWSLYAGELLPSGEPDPLFFLGLGSPFSGQQELYYVHPEFSLNYTRWNNEEFNELYAELEATLDPDDRREMMFRLQEIVMDDCPWVFLWKQVDFYGASANLEWEARADERIWMGESSFTGL